MPCYKPLRAYQSEVPAANGKRQVFFSFSARTIPIDLPCGQCIGCRLERSRQWAVRIMHEASMHERNCFITLTYDDDHVPDDHSLHVSHFQKFMKRYRKSRGEVRFFHCGEYGEKFYRPHYHACIFGDDFSDKQPFSGSSASPLFVSDSLSKLWKFGFSTVGELNFESAAYCARYVTKKVTGEKAAEHYMRVSAVTGEIFEVAPEYTTMSRRPGIGRGWYDRFGPEVFPLDRVVVRGVECKPPKFYDNLYEIDSPENFLALKEKRKLDSQSKYSDNELLAERKRLPAREEFAKLKQKTFSPRKDL